MRVRFSASALSDPPLPALLAVSLVAWIGLGWLGHGAADGHGMGAHGGGHGPSVGGGWLVMLVAMMAPLLAGPLRHLRDRSLAPRRPRATLLFLAGYGLVWTLAGAVLLALAAALRPLAMLSPWAPAVLAALAVIAWQATPWKQACLNRCHRRPRLAASGLAADRDALRFGLTKGGWCVGACWALMGLPLLLPRGGFVGMVLVGAWMLLERWSPTRAPSWGIPIPLVWRMG